MTEVKTSHPWALETRRPKVWLVARDDARTQAARVLAPKTVVVSLSRNREEAAEPQSRSAKGSAAFAQAA